jgi:hypothetical protein
MRELTMTETEEISGGAFITLGVLAGLSAGGMLVKTIVDESQAWKEYADDSVHDGSSSGYNSNAAYSAPATL